MFAICVFKWDLVLFSDHFEASLVDVDNNPFCSPLDVSHYTLIWLQKGLSSPGARIHAEQESVCLACNTASLSPCMVVQINSRV